MVNHNIRAAVGIILSITLSMLAFYFSHGPDSVTPTGFAVGQPPDTKGYIMQGTSFEAIQDGSKVMYIFTDKNEWYESIDGVSWISRPEFGSSTALGLYLIQASGAKIYFNGMEITDMTEFAKQYKQVFR